MKDIKLIATDLDGTFLKNNHTISGQNLEALSKLRDSGIVTVAATGRNLRKVREVITDDTPFDHVVFSSGAGIYNWKNKTLEYKRNIPVTISPGLTKYLIEKRLNFNAFRAAPDNHFLWHHRGGTPCCEFERYFSFHNSYSTQLQVNGPFTEELCQYLVIIPGNDDFYHSLKSDIENKFPGIGVIRSTSPLGTGYIWLEVFHENVSKGNAVLKICNMLGISQHETVSIGNDFNDVSLLDFTKHSFIVDNAPGVLKNKYLPAPSHEDDGFSAIANQVLSHS